MDWSHPLRSGLATKKLTNSSSSPSPPSTHAIPHMRTAKRINEEKKNPSAISLHYAVRLILRVIEV